jgi:hypothetical protein
MPRVVVTKAFDYEVPGERAMIAFEPTGGKPTNVTQGQRDAIVAKGAGHEVPADGKALAPRTRKPRNPVVAAEEPKGE